MIAAWAGVALAAPQRLDVVRGDGRTQRGVKVTARIEGGAVSIGARGPS